MVRSNKKVHIPARGVYPVSNLALVKRKMLSWACQFNIFCYLDNHQYAIAPNSYECLLGAGIDSILSSEQHSLSEVQSLIIEQGKWCFGHLTYEYGTSFSTQLPAKPDPIGFAPFTFFVPQVVAYIQDNQLYIEGTDPDLVYEEIMGQSEEATENVPSLTVRQKLSREQYLNAVKKLQQHIVRGDCYEINFCQEFYSEGAMIDPVQVYNRLSSLSPNPFAALYKLDHRYLICASPERFLYKEGNQILSQPIKGTAKRDLENPVSDEAVKDQLRMSAKERAENVMVVDLVRNDLSKICQSASVKVKELFGIYSYPQVHQMISTISGVVQEDVSFTQMVEATFPMGSMTGAPKKRVMELIHQYEPSARGIFSGTVGYINPNGNFDFNVVIRSIMYNAATQYLSYQVGSGITFYAEAEKEWEECLLKAEAIKKVLTG